MSASPFIAAIGGVFLYAKDPKALFEWYKEMLGIEAAFEVEGSLFGTAFMYKPMGEGLEQSSIVWSIGKLTDEMVAEGRPRAMVNYRVRDMQALADHLKSKGIDFEFKHYEGEGYFGHLTDPEGNKLEIWQDQFKY